MNRPSNRPPEEPPPPWIGSIPEDWELSPLKSFVTGAKNGLWGDAPEDADEDAHVYCARVADFERTRAVLAMEDPTIRGVPPRKWPGRLLRPGDLLLEKSGGGEKQPVGFVVLVESLPGRTVCSNFVARMPVADGADARYVRYLHQHFYSARINTRSIKQSTGIQNLDADSYLAEASPRPPLPTQRAIASFLDRETEKIDTLIEKKRRLLELLEEKRTALITRAVTRGLDPGVPMKDSGVEWLGEIPEHWEVARLNRVIHRMTNGYVGPTRGIMVEDGIPYIQGMHVGKREIRFTPDGPYYVTEEWSDARAKSILRLHDVLIVQSGQIGKVGLVTEEFVGANCHALIITRTKNDVLLGTFLSYLVMSGYFQAHLQAVKTGDMLPHLNVTRVKYLPVVLPSLGEQRAVVEYLDGHTERLDRQMALENRSISLLQEYRTALISAAVTGKINVRDEVRA